MQNYNYTAIHANSNELDVLDFIQGQTCRWKDNSNVRLYVGEMEKILENPHVMMSILKLARRKYAKGGVVSIDRLTPEKADEYRNLGRFGDDAIAVVGPRLKGLLDMMAEHKGTINPHTGLPEYFSLGGMFNSLGSGITNAFSAVPNMFSGGLNMMKQFASPLLRMGAGALPMLGQLAGTALGSRFGPMGAGLGSQFGSMLGGLGGNMMNQYAGQQGASPYDQYASSAGQHMGEMANNMYQYGMPAQMAAGNAMSNFGRQNFGDQGYGPGLQGAGAAFMQHQGPGQAMNNFYNQGGFNPLIDQARTAISNVMPMFGGGQGGQQPQSPDEASNQQAFSQLPYAG